MATSGFESRIEYRRRVKFHLADQVVGVRVGAHLPTRGLESAGLVRAGDRRERSVW